MCMIYVCEHGCQFANGGLRPSWWSWFSPSTSAWVLGVKFRLIFIARVFFWWAIPPASKSSLEYFFDYYILYKYSFVKKHKVHVRSCGSELDFHTLPVMRSIVMKAQVYSKYPFSQWTCPEDLLSLHYTQYFIRGHLLIDWPTLLSTWSPLPSEFLDRAYQSN